MNIVLTRIDNRLIHGQIVVTWHQHVNANLIVVANDKVAGNEVRKKIMGMVVPMGVGVRFYSIQDAIKTLPKAALTQRIMLVCETPQDVLALVKGGITLKKVNVGNMHYSEGKMQISTTVCIDEDDAEIFKQLDSLGVECTVQRIPTDKAINILELVNS